ncbi:unnamed protein product [Calypogeia fissa]
MQGEEIRQKDALLIQRDIEVQALTFANTNCKTIIDGLEKEVTELTEDRDDASQDALNAIDKVEALMNKIKELEGQLFVARSEGTPSKRQRNT